MAHDEDILNVSGFRTLDTGVLEPFYSKQKVEEVDGSGSAVSHHLEKSYSPPPSEEPLLHADSCTILLPYTHILVGMSVPPKMSDTPLLLLEWLAPDLEKGVVESERALESFSEDESLGAKP